MYLHVGTYVIRLIFFLLIYDDVKINTQKKKRSYRRIKIIIIINKVKKKKREIRYENEIKFIRISLLLVAVDGGVTLTVAGEHIILAQRYNDAANSRVQTTFYRAYIMHASTPIMYTMIRHTRRDRIDVVGKRFNIIIVAGSVRVGFILFIYFFYTSV